jgi:tRNA A-37 threonylcarbamoyl transferase component Bud32
MDPMIGKTIGKYRIVEHLGRGGMAEVYKAYQSNLDRYVAIKMMHAFLADEKEFLTRFEREAKVVATLRHPNIVQVYDFDFEGDVAYMVMEFISGETLKSRMQALEMQGQWVALDDAARIVLAVGSALKYAHERGMVHRDVKPANVMITLEGQVILTDFGIAKIVSTSNLTASGAMVGTPSYMAPEQGMGQPGDERSDIYSLGVMLYQLVLGRLPYDADTPLAVVLKHINEPLPLPKALNPEISDELNAVILKSLEKDPHNRYQKVADLAADLRQAMGLSPEDSAANSAKGAAIKLAGATLIGRVGGSVTPLPVSATLPPERSGTQVAAPKTVVAEAVVNAPNTVVFPPGGAPAPAPVTAPVAEKKRPGWLIPVIGLALLAVVAVGLIVALSGQGAAPPPSPTATATNDRITPSVAAVASLTSEAASTPTVVPITSQLLSLKQETELRDKAGSDPASQIEGLLPAGSQFFVKARIGDSQWVRIETPDGVDGWIEAAATGLTLEELQALPVATTLTRLTDTPTPTEVPTDTPTSTLAPTQTKTPAPTRTPGPTRPPVTPKPATPTGAPPSPTTAAVAEPLGYGFDVKMCIYLGINYECNVVFWGSGGDGHYNFEMMNPDTGNPDIRLDTNFVTYLVRYARCKKANVDFRIWDNSGNHLEPGFTLNPDDFAGNFPGGAGCTK